MCIRDSCGLGQNAPNPVISTLRYFRDEYEAHITERRCPPGACEMNSIPVRELRTNSLVYSHDGAPAEAAKA